MKKNQYSIYTIFILLCIWQAAAVLVHDELSVPTIQQVIVKMGEIIADKDFLLVIFSTVGRTFLSFLLGLAAALIFGMISGLNKTIYQVVYPIISIFRSVPTMSIIIIALLWLGQGKAPVFIGFVIVFPLIFSIVVEGIREVDNRYIELAQCYKISMQSRIRDIYLPSIKAAVLAGMRSTMGLNFKVMIAAEVLGQPQYAVGTMIMMEKRYLDMAGVFGWSIILICIAAAVDLLLKIGIQYLTGQYLGDKT